MSELEAGILVGVIGAASGLLGVTVGAIVSYKIAKRQIQASVVSAGRQAWISELRTAISEFQSIIGRVILKVSGLTNPKPEKWEEELHDLHAASGRCLVQITLMLNPTEEDHITLNDLLRETNEIHKACLDAGDYKNIGPHFAKINTCAQEIMKREWERVKSGD